GIRPDLADGGRRIAPHFCVFALESGRKEIDLATVRRTELVERLDGQPARQGVVFGSQEPEQGRHRQFGLGAEVAERLGRVAAYLAVGVLQVANQPGHARGVARDNQPALVSYPDDGLGPAGVLDKVGRFRHVDEQADELRALQTSLSDADHLAARIDERAAAVAGVGRRLGLDDESLVLAALFGFPVLAVDLADGTRRVNPQAAAGPGVADGMDADARRRAALGHGKRLDAVRDAVDLEQ